MNRLTIIKELRKQKKTYKEIGEILDITKQRVHQIFKDYRGGPNPKKIIQIKEEQGNRCVLCDSKKNLEIHHINGIKRDNKKENLVCLCRKCHLRIDANDRAILPARKQERKFYDDDFYKGIKQRS